MIFPVPIVEARAVVRAPNWLTSPSALVSLVTDRRMAVPILRWITPVRMVMKIWVPRSKMIIHQPHTRLSIWFITLPIAFIIEISSLSQSEISQDCRNSTRAYRHRKYVLYALVRYALKFLLLCQLYRNIQNNAIKIFPLNRRFFASIYVDQNTTGPSSQYI